MNGLTGRSGRQYTPLPIDNNAGYPQSVPFLCGGHAYRLSIYVNASASLLKTQPVSLDLPLEEALLVVRIDRENVDGSRQIIFLRKVVPDLEYEAENIALYFPNQRVARNNLNGRGQLGSGVVGGVAPRWA